MRDAEAELLAALADLAEVAPEDELHREEVRAAVLADLDQLDLIASQVMPHV